MNFLDDADSDRILTHRLFSDLKFFVPSHIDDGGKLKNVLCDNGGQVIDADEDNVLYILDSFERSELFAKLCDKGSRIVSTKCIYDSVKDNKPLPNVKHPLFARFMEGLVICLPKCEDVEEELANLVRYMGGQCVENITNSTTYLVAKQVGSIQYQVAQQNGINILIPEWVKECWRQQELLDSKKFLLPPFAGCVISVTGLSASTRNEIQRLAKSYGGEYTPNLTKRCSHLISRVPQGIKYRYALEWGIHCVSVHWFFDSINLQVCADETQYFLPMSEANRQALFNPLSTSTRDLNRLSPALQKKHLMQLHNRYQTARKHPLNQNHPYDLYIIRSPFTRSRTGSNTAALNLGSSTSTTPKHIRRSKPVLRPASHSHSSITSPPSLLVHNSTQYSTWPTLIPDTKQSEKSDTMDYTSTHKSDPPLEDSDKKILSEDLPITELYKLLDMCNDTIAYYKELAKTTDFSFIVDLLVQKGNDSGSSKEKPDK